MSMYKDMYMYMCCMSTHTVSESVPGDEHPNLILP